jgi:hypothetical protein
MTVLAACFVTSRTDRDEDSEGAVPVDPLVELVPIEPETSMTRTM